MTRPSDQVERGQSLLAQVSDAMVQAFKTYYGRGPTHAKSYMIDDYLLVAMRDPFTVVENTLIRAGRHHLVREYRQAFEDEMASELMGQVEELTGRKVLGYQSQIVFDPDTAFEIFILDPAGDGADEVRATAEEQGLMGEASPALTESRES